MSQYFCTATWLCEITPDGFDPPPKVDSAFIRLEPKHASNPEGCNSTCKCCHEHFNQRRKTVSNSLKSLFSAQELKELAGEPTKRAHKTYRLKIIWN